MTGAGPIDILMYIYGKRGCNKITVINAGVQYTWNLLKKNGFPVFFHSKIISKVKQGVMKKQNEKQYEQKL